MGGKPFETAIRQLEVIQQSITYIKPLKLYPDFEKTNLLPQKDLKSG